MVLADQHSNLLMIARGRARVTAARLTQNPVVSIRQSGGTGITRLVSVDAVAAKISAAEVAKLRRSPAVKEKC